MRHSSIALAVLGCQLPADVDVFPLGVDSSPSEVFSGDVLPVEAFPYNPHNTSSIDLALMRTTPTKQRHTCDVAKTHGRETICTIDQFITHFCCRLNSFGLGHNAPNSSQSLFARKYP